MNPEGDYLWAHTRMVLRGLPIALREAQQARKLVTEYNERVGGEFLRRVGTTSKAYVPFKNYLNDQGVPVPNVASDTLEEYLDIHEAGVRRWSDAAVWAMKNALILNKSSVSKLDALVLGTDPSDNRYRWASTFHGAKTGRTTGKGFQPTNLFSPTLKSFQVETPGYDDNVSKVFDTLFLPNAVERLESDWGAPFLEIIACVLRSFISAERGKKLYDADFSAIEAKLVLFMAGERAYIREQQERGDFYLPFAIRMAGKEVDKKSPERKAAKAPMLGLGFLMSYMGFVRNLIEDPKIQGYRDDLPAAGHTKGSALAALDGIYREEDIPKGLQGIKAVIEGKRLYDIYHSQFPGISAFAYSLKDAMCAVASGRVLAARSEVGGILYRRLRWNGIDGVVCEPSPRAKIFYPQIQYRTEVGISRRGNEYTKEIVTSYMEDKKKWVPRTLIPQVLVENAIQATARGVMSDAQVRIEMDGRFSPLLSVYDQVLSEGSESASLEDYSTLMFKQIEYMPEFPLTGEASVTKHFGK